MTPIQRSEEILASLLGAMLYIHYGGPPHLNAGVSLECVAVLDRSLLESFMARFFGYGSLTGRFWFVGMEEAGGNTEHEVQQRLSAWHALGCKPIVDCAEFHSRVDDENGSPKSLRLFTPSAEIQATWGPLIRLFLCATRDGEVSRDDVRTGQSAHWGRESSDNCLFELLPLPSPSADDWMYAEWSDLDYLRDRDSYRAELIPKRLNTLRAMLSVNQNSPRVIVCYGSTCLDSWSELTDIDFRAGPRIKVCGNGNGRDGQARIVKRGDRVFACIHHPNYQNRKDYFEGIGRQIRTMQ